MSDAEGHRIAGPPPAAGEDRLAHAERLLRLNALLVAGLIHDLRTPLMAINLSAEVALMRSHAEAVEQAARRIKMSSERMSRIFDHLLNLSRRADDVAGLDLRGADLCVVVNALIADRRTGTARPDIEVSARGDATGVFDADRLRLTLDRVLLTFLEHAPPGAISVEIDGTHPDRLLLLMSTAGVIPAEVQERLFVAREPRAGLELPGLGFGLAEVDPLVRAHGGSVLGRSRAGSGTVFELLLPRDASAAT